MMEKSQSDFKVTDIQRNFMSELLQVSLFEYDFKSQKIQLSLYSENSSSEKTDSPQKTLEIPSTFTMIHPDDQIRSDNFFKELKKSSEIHSAEIRLLSDEGFFQWVKIFAKTFFKNGSPEKIFGYFTKIENKRPIQEEKKKKQDPLTRLLNQTEIQKLIIFELNTRLEIRRDALVVLNFDNLAEINENLGHVFGDEILILAAEKISKVCEQSNCLMGRILSDEFLLFFKDVKNDSDLQEIFSRILEELKKIYVGEVGIPQFSVYIGAVMSSGETDLKSLLEKAHKTIYLQKTDNQKISPFYSPDIDKKILNINKNIISRTEKLNTDIISENRIADMLLDILSKTKDLDSAVNFSIMKIGTLYNLASVRILELLQDGRSTKIQKTYDWASNTEYKDRSNPMRLSHAEILQLQTTNEMLLWPLDSDGQESREIPPIFHKIYPWISNFSFAQNKIYGEGKFFGFVLFLHKDKNHKWVKEEIATLRTLSKILSGYMPQIRAFNRAEMLVKKLSQIDSLTGFYHYDDFRHNAIEIIATDRGKNSFIVSSIDIRGFKYINEFYGYKSGDLFLKSMADFISQSPYFELGCRMLSDIFLILSKIPKNTTEEAINDAILKNIDIFLEKQIQRYPRCNLRIVSGTCKIMLPEIDIQKAMDNANSLRKELKSLFKSCSKIYSGNIADKLEFKKYLTNSLPTAFARHEFLVYFQPKIDLKTGTIAGAEALVRWGKNGDILQPRDFIPSLEENGLITMIDFYIYESVCRYISNRIEEGKPVVPISVNVSGHHLLSSEFISKLLPLINRYKIPSELLEFELTETTFLDNLQTASQVFSTLHQEGFKISIDDFGSGYSSTTLLKELPFDIVKLDKSFLARNEMNNKDKIVLTCIIDMAKKLNIKVLCEGAETKKQVDFLKNTGCDIIQGFYFSKPIPIEKFNMLIEENHIFTV